MDSGWGFMAWRGTLLGALNYIVAPDPANISRDSATFLTGWSPGQYLVPGAISLTGTPLGVAITITVILSLLTCLIGWLRVVSTFAPDTKWAPLLVLLIGLFRYSTSPFGDYDRGGEILLQAVTPWLILAAHRMPHGNAVRTAAFSVSVVFLAFLAKLTGLIVIGAALAASGIVELARGRKITRGMIGGAFGALLAYAVLYLSFLTKGPTPATPTNWSLPFYDIAFSVLVPWVAGISWVDFIWWFFARFNAIFDPSLWFILPVSALFCALVLAWQPDTNSKRKLKYFSLVFYGIVVMTFILLYIRGADISVEERHFRSVGTLLYVCVVMAAVEPGIPKWIGGVFLSLCALMSVYGLEQVASHALPIANGRWLDRTTWTNELNVDEAALDFIRTAYVREGRRAVFVLATPEVALTLPTEARIIAPWDFEIRYAGRVPGHLFVVMQNDIADTSIGDALLSSFTDYPRGAWERRKFAISSVFFQ